MAYDVIVVGARCAGSPTAMLLARKGYRVLLLEKNSFPSDLAMSTHLVHQPGIARLKRWGLLEKLQASNCPPISRYSFQIASFVLRGRPPPYDGVAEAYAPRRRVLDEILVKAAVEAGADLRESFRVRDILSDNGRVCGIRGNTKTGATNAEIARIVVGADGMSSVVARLVKAPKYNIRPPLQGTYFSYWSGVPMDGAEFHSSPYRFAYGWPTNDNLSLIGVNWVAKDFKAIGRNVEANYLQVLDAVAPGLAKRVRVGKREGRWTGTSIDNYFRKPYGPGWALVGDAGYKKDPGTAAGITDAFRDAEFLAEALDEGFSGPRSLEAALADYERRRNEVATPIYEFTCEMAAFEPPTTEQVKLFEALSANEAETDRFFGLIAQTTSVREFFAPENVRRILTSA